MNLFGQPMAIAAIKGSESYPDIHGRIVFYPQQNGTLVSADISGLPETEDGFFGFHIHEGESCGGAEFEETGGHWNPSGDEHPRHAGDLPPLMRNGSKARMTVETGRFTVKEVLGKTVAIHGMPDDFRSQPAGDSGEKIACGVIRKA